nr:TetR/AcrR family transcriptional regulator [uncultured Cohaesibacter sp.]
MEHSTYQKLVIAAANLLRQKGYAATGISDILETAGVTRGSLYHHFPGGKMDLGIAAARYSAGMLLNMIESACSKARSEGGDYQDAIIEFCNKVHASFEENKNWRFMTVSATMQDGGERNEIFTNEARELYGKIRLKAIDEGRKFGLASKQSYLPLRQALLMLEGSWLLSRVLEDPMPMRSAVKFIEEEKLLHELRQQAQQQTPHDDALSGQ